VVAIRIYQPVAAHLGCETPGGFTFDVPVTGVVRLDEILGSYEECEYDLAELAYGEYGASCMIAVNGRFVRDGVRTEVTDGDEVSVFRVISGG
jgi:sulfur carrier protein ThiS